MPQTPDRTDAIQGNAESPAPIIAEAIRLLSARARFAVIPCITAHHFLPQVRAEVAFPVLDIVAETLRSARERGVSRIGILATTGTLESEVFERTARRAASPLKILSLRRLPGGEALQRRLVMGPIYDRDGEYGCSLKAGGADDASLRERLAVPLRKAARALVSAGAEAIVLGCTEIPLALGREAIDATPLIDPLRVAARAAVEIARGDRDLPPV